MRASDTGIDLYWIPLGADGSGFVRLNGRIYESITARMQRRRPLDLYHTALEVRLAGERYIVETMWPSPDGNTAARGVVVEGPVFARWLAASRVFRYEVRCWRDGTLPDADKAVGGPRLVTTDPDCVRRLLDGVGSVPPLTWGRDQMATGEMWNSNSVISWLLTRSGLPVDEILPPAGGRAPGWDAGIRTARRVTSQDPAVSTLKTKITTPHLGETREFYESVFGLVLVEEWDEPDDRGVILEFPGGHRQALLEIYEGESPADFTGLSLQFRVDDLRSFAEGLSADLSFEGPRRRPWGSTYLYLRDPNDIQVIVYEGGW